MKTMKTETWADSPIHDMIRDAGLDKCERTAGSGSDAPTCSPSLIPLKDTRVEMAGVMRCCLGTVAEEYADPEHPGVAIGMKSCCRHCSEPFTLVAATPHPKWVPDWVIRKDNV